jgi:hypothetical protein
MPKTSHPTLSYNSELFSYASIPIAQVTSHKYLGVTLSHGKPHIHLLLDKARNESGYSEVLNFFYHQ